MNESLKIIAEIGSVHDGSLGNALKAVEAVANCGANVAKFQTHIAEAETLPDAPMPSYFRGEPRLEYFKRTAFTEMQWKIISDHCREYGVQFLSSPFSLEAVDLLEEVGVEIYKIPSGEVSNVPLLEHIVRTGKPVYLSSGMSNWQELDQAVKVLRPGGPLTIMQCSSIYPCPPEKVGLNVMLEMKHRYGLPVGFSDHTLGQAACVSAVALGATVIEKHFTFSRMMYGSDARHSLEPEDFRELCSNLREAETIRNNPINKDSNTEYSEMKRIFEKSIVTRRDLPANHILEISDLAFKKPGDGIPAARYSAVLGKSIKAPLPSNRKISWEDLK
ncbi:MAG: N-acetylneuraminate synthase [Spirochaetaceae bacterium]|nr:N-acetylneuraminate synthase [Spirochaetaceae bacterium]|tara:strand:- start:27252 stop:28247 length:996 start_codon:yes stop_codon:yes gene_type:complete